MEIYNFVDYKTTPKRTKTMAARMPSLQKPHFSLPIKKRQHARTAIPLRKVFSFRSFLIFIGGTISSISEKIKKNSRPIGITAIVISISILATALTLIIYSYSANHTSPLTLINLQESEIARLDKIMADFAMENYVGVNKSGDIENAASIPISVFTQPVEYKSYKVLKGDSISGITRKFGLSNISTLISVNDIGNVRALAAGQTLKIPSIDGIIYKVKTGDSINSIATKQGISVESLLDVNDLDSEVLQIGQSLFLPGVKLDQKVLNLAMGDQFICPIKAAYRFSDKFGWRTDPISGKRSYHKGDDLACPARTPIFAALSGKVIYVGESWLYGKHIIIDHGNGYQTLYAHMSQILASKDQWVNQETRIGLVGSTGYSTGPHLHFTVYKNGNPIAPSTVVRY